ncbi:291_t:CDS:2, partial [Scutellospora calospora]
MSGHPIVRRLTEQHIVNVEVIAIAGSRLKEIITTLKQNNLSILITNSDIYNMCAKLQQQNLAGTIITSRIERAYAALKAYLQGSIGDLYWVYIAILLVVTNQKKELNTMIIFKWIHILVFATNDVLYTNIK